MWTFCVQSGYKKLHHKSYTHTVHRLYTPYKQIIIKINMAEILTKRHLKNKNRVNRFIMAKLGISPTVFTSKCKRQDVVFARHCAFYLLKWHFKMSPLIISFLYQKDRTTVLYALKNVEKNKLEKFIENIWLSTYPQR